MRKNWLVKPCDASGLAWGSGGSRPWCGGWLGGRSNGVLHVFEGVAAFGAAGDGADEVVVAVGQWPQRAWNSRRSWVRKRWKVVRQRVAVREVMAQKRGW